MTTKSKRSLISESVVVIRIGVHLALNNKARLDMIFIGIIYIGACLAQRKKVRIHDASQGCPPSAAAMSSFSCGKLPATGLRTKINMFGSRAIVGFIFFLDRTQS
jgi:hypothetical protein